MTSSVLKRPAVLKRIGVSKTTLATMIAEGEFPKPIKLSSKSIGWIDTEVQSWLDSKIAERDSVQVAPEGGVR